MKSTSSVLSCIVPTVVHLKGHYHTQGHPGFSYIVFLGFNKVFYFTLWSMIHFEFIFVKVLRSVSIFIFLHVDVQLFQHHFLKEYLCSIVSPLLLCQRSVDCIYVGLFLVSLFYFIDLCVCFTSTTLS